MPVVSLKKSSKSKPQDIYVPSGDNLTEHLPYESIIIMGKASLRSKNFRQFIAIGYVLKIIHGESFDKLVLLSSFTKSRKREFIVKDNVARRQLLTLQKGYPCMVWGLTNHFKKSIKKGKFYQKVFVRAFYAQAIMAWYVPKGINIKVHDYEKDENFYEMTDKEKQYIEDLIGGESDE